MSSNEPPKATKAYEPGGSRPLKIKDLTKNATSYWIEKHPDLPIVPFCMMAVGFSRSGKTNAIMSILDMLGFKDIWGNNIFLFTGTKGLNDDYKDIVDEKRTFDGFNRTKILEVIEKQEGIIRRLGKKYAKHVLIICEDLADEGSFNNSKLLQRIAFRGRHALVSIIVSSQKLSSISRGVRINSTYIAAFRPSGSEEEWYYNEFIPKRLVKQAQVVFNKVWDEPYQFLLIDRLTKDPNRRFRKGLSEPLNIS
jgi:hypothetical protein